MMSSEPKCFDICAFRDLWEWQNQKICGLIVKRLSSKNVRAEVVLNPLIPESDQHLISPFNIIHESNIKVLRIKEMIMNWRTYWFLNKFSLPTHQRPVWRMCILMLGCKFPFMINYTKINSTIHFKYAKKKSCLLRFSKSLLFQILSLIPFIWNNFSHPKFSCLK